MAHRGVVVGGHRRHRVRAMVHRAMTHRSVVRHLGVGRRGGHGLSGMHVVVRVIFAHGLVFLFAAWLSQRAAPAI
jgi:hypothetical protein